MKKTAKMLLCCILLFVLCLPLVGCGNKTEKQEETGTSDTCISLAYSWDCEYYAEKETYEIDDVTLRFTYGHKLSRETRYSFFSRYLYYNGYTEAEQKEIWATEDYPPVPVYLFFYSFGHQYLIKTIDDFFDPEYANGNHSEEITVPAELFYNEYGLIRFEFTDYETGDGSSFYMGKTSYCSFYYKKEGETVQLSQIDLNPESEYYKTYYEEMKEKGAFPDNGVTSGFVEREKLYYSGELYDFAEDKDDYCAAWSKVDQYNDSAYADFYYGSVFGDRIFEYVDLYFVTDDETVEDHHIKRITDYTEEGYGIEVKKYYDYYGKEHIADVRFTHHEIITIPQFLFTKAEGTISLYVYGKESGKTNSELLCVQPVAYYYMFPNGFSDERPYNRIGLAPIYLSQKDFLNIVENNSMVVA